MAELFTKCLELICKNYEGTSLTSSPLDQMLEHIPKNHIEQTMQKRF